MNVGIGITGANGYIGSALHEGLLHEGYDVCRLVRTPTIDQDRKFSLADDDYSLSGLHTLIHCAWDLTASTWTDIEERNIEGSKRLFDRARKDGVRTIIFISSMAAFDGCRSLYGRSKGVVENYVTVIGGIVVRPGTVYGGKVGGIVAAITGLMKKFRIAPLIGGGGHTLYTVHIDDLTNLVKRIVSDPEVARGMPLIAADPKPITLREFFRSIAKQIGVRPLLIPVPGLFLFLPLKLLELLKIKPPLRSDSVTSITQGSGKDISAENPYGITFRSL